MSAFSSRRRGYRAGLYLLFMSTVFFIVGFGSPYWKHVQTSGGYSIRSTVEGLWMTCNATETLISSTWHCDSISNSPVSAMEAADWFKAVRALLTLCLMGLLASCIYAMVANCCRTVPGPRVRCLEVLAAVSGTLGFSGTMVYLDRHPGMNDPGASLVWGYYFALIDAVLAVIAAVLIAIFNAQYVNVNAGNPIPMTYPVVMHGGYSTSGQPYVVCQQPGCQPYILNAQGTRPVVITTSMDGPPLNKEQELVQSAAATSN